MSDDFEIKKRIKYIHDPNDRWSADGWNEVLNAGNINDKNHNFTLNKFYYDEDTSTLMIYCENCFTRCSANFNSKKELIYFNTAIKDLTCEEIIIKNIIE